MINAGRVLSRHRVAVPDRACTRTGMCGVVVLLRPLPSHGLPPESVMMGLRSSGRLHRRHGVRRAPLSRHPGCSTVAAVGLAITATRCSVATRSAPTSPAPTIPLAAQQRRRCAPRRRYGARLRPRRDLRVGGGGGGGGGGGKGGGWWASSIDREVTLWRRGDTWPPRVHAYPSCWRRARCYRNNWRTLREDDIRRPDGTQAIYA